MYGPSGPPSVPPFGSNTQTSFEIDTISDISTSTYTSFDSTCVSEGSAVVARGAQAGPVFGPDRWTSERGQSAGGNVDILAPDPEMSDDGMEMSFEATENLLALTKDEESEMTLSEDSGQSPSKVTSKVNTSTSSSVSMPSPVSHGPIRGISPAVTQVRSVRPRSIRVDPRPGHPARYPPNFKHPSEIVFKRGKPFYACNLSATPSRASAPRLPYRFSVGPHVPGARPQFPPPPPRPVLPPAAPRVSMPPVRQPPAATVTSGDTSGSVMPSAAPRSSPVVRQPPAATVTSGELEMSDLNPQAMSTFKPPEALRSSTPIPASQPPAAPGTPGSVSNMSPVIPGLPGHDFTRPPPRLGPVNRPPPPSFNPMEGRTVRVEPTSNVGLFAPAVEYAPALNSFATTSDYVRIPVINHLRQVVPSKRPQQPKLSPGHKVNVYISSHPIHGLCKSIEQVYREDLSLELLRMYVKYDLDHVTPGCKLSIIVVDFLVNKQRSVGWHKTIIYDLVTLVHQHPSGSVIRIGNVFINPSLCVPDNFNTKFKLDKNSYKLVLGINEVIKYLMENGCSKSTFGSKSKHVGLTVSGKGWKPEAWEGYNPIRPASITRCYKLTIPFQRKRSFLLRSALDSELRALPVV